jgi:hypothetical protein
MEVKESTVNHRHLKAKTVVLASWMVFKFNVNSNDEGISGSGRLPADEVRQLHCEAGLSSVGYATATQVRSDH